MYNKIEKTNLYNRETEGDNMYGINITKYRYTLMWLYTSK